MRRESLLLVLIAGGCGLFPDLSSLSGNGGADASTDVNTDAPVFQGGVSGDVEFYSASVTGDVSYRVWSHASSVWSAPSPVTSSAGAIVPWLVPAAGSSGVALGLSFWTGAQASAVSLELLPPPSFQPAFAPSQTQGSKGAHRSFDITFEKTSGDGLAVFANTTSGPVFSTKSGSGAWSPPTNVLTTPMGLSVDWVSLVPNPTSDEITLVYTDTGQTLYSVTWNGSAWMAASPTAIDTGLNVADFPAFVGAYGATAGNFLLAWGYPSTCNDGADPLHYATKPKGSNTFSSNQATPSVIAGPGPLAAATEPGTDRIAIAMLEWCSSAGADGENDFSVATWDGSTFVDETDLVGHPGIDYTTNVGSTPVGVAWVGTTGTAVAVYAADTTLSWASWTSQSGWKTQTTTLAQTQTSLVSFQLLQMPTDVMLFMEDMNRAVWVEHTDGTTFTDANSGAPLADTVYGSDGRPFGALIVP